jgi:hypothetical protein
LIIVFVNRLLGWLLVWKLLVIPLFSLTRLLATRAFFPVQIVVTYVTLGRFLTLHQGLGSLKGRLRQRHFLLLVEGRPRMIVRLFLVHVLIVKTLIKRNPVDCQQLVHVGQ